MTSVETSPYDSYTFTFAYDDPTCRWKFRIESDEQVEFELIIPDGCVEEDLQRYGFDWAPRPEESEECLGASRAKPQANA